MFEQDQYVDHARKRIGIYQFKKKLGSGNFSEVYLVQDTTTNQLYAAKITTQKKLQTNEKLRQLLHNQQSNLERCSSENVIRLKQAFSSGKHYYLICEYCDGGTLEDYVKKRVKLQEEEARKFIAQIINGFKDMHKVEIVHRDLKLANILLHKGNIKIADLGFSKNFAGITMTRTILGTTLTMAPEVLAQQPYGDSSDIWSLGVVYYYMLVGRYPYIAASDKALLTNIRSSGPPKYPEELKISQASQTFIGLCLIYDAKKRNWKDVFNHELASPMETTKVKSRPLPKIKARRSIMQVQDLPKAKSEYIPIQKQPIQENDWRINIAQKRKLQQRQNAEKKRLEEEQVIRRRRLEEETKQIAQAQARRLRERQMVAERRSPNQRKWAGVATQFEQRRKLVMLRYNYGVAPGVELCDKLNLAHTHYLFLLCKKTLLEMDELNISLSELNLAAFGHAQFANTQHCQKLLLEIQKDITLLARVGEQLLINVQTSNQYLGNQLRLDRPTRNFETLFNDEVNSYAFQLHDYLEGKELPPYLKHIALRLIKYLVDSQEKNKIMRARDYEEKMKMEPYSEQALKLHFKKQLLRTALGFSFLE